MIRLHTYSALLDANCSSSSILEYLMKKKRCRKRSIEISPKYKNVVRTLQGCNGVRMDNTIIRPAHLVVDEC